MQIDPTLIWNLALTLIVAPFAWAFSKMFQEIKRIQLLLAETRETYIKREELNNEVTQLNATCNRIENKIDKLVLKER